MNFISNALAKRMPIFYGFVMMLVTMLLQICTSPGQTFAISAFKPAIRDSLSMTEAQLSLAYMLGTMLAAIPLSLVGPLSDRWGLRTVTAIVCAALAGTCLFASTVTVWPTLLFAFFLLRFLGQGSLSLLASNSISMWFRTRIGRVSAVMSVGGALAFGWIPSWVDSAIASYGWRATYQGLGLIVAVISIPILLLFFRNRPEDIGQKVDGLTESPGDQAFDSGASGESSEPGESNEIETCMTLKQAVRHRAFHILAAINGVWAMIGTGILFHLYTLCADRGLDRDFASSLFKSFGLAMLFAQFFGGFLADRYPLNRLLGIGAMILSVGVGLIWFDHGAQAMQGFAVLFGAGQGLLLAVGAVIWVRYYGRPHLGSIRGTAMCLMVGGSGCGPFIMGVLRDHDGQFDRAIAGFFVGMSALAVTAWFATSPTNR